MKKRALYREARAPSLLKLHYVGHTAAHVSSSTYLQHSTSQSKPQEATQHAGESVRTEQPTRSISRTSTRNHAELHHAPSCCSDSRWGGLFDESGDSHSGARFGHAPHERLGFSSPTDGPSRRSSSLVVPSNEASVYTYPALILSSICCILHSLDLIRRDCSGCAEHHQLSMSLSGRMPCRHGLGPSGLRLRDTFGGLN